MQFISFFKRNWNIVFQLALVIVLILNKFVIPIGFSSSLLEGAMDDTMFAKFFVACLLLLFIVPSALYSKKRMARFWWLASAFFLITAIYFHVFVYNAFVNNHSVWSAFEDRLKVSGNVVKPSAQKDIDRALKEGKIKEVNYSDILYRLFDGDPTSIWEVAGIKDNSNKILVYYLITVGLYSLLLMCLIQSVYCINKRR